MLKYCAWISTTAGEEVALPVMARMAPPPNRCSTEEQMQGMIAHGRTRFGRRRNQVELRINQFLRDYAATKRRRQAEPTWEP